MKTLIISAILFFAGPALAGVPTLSDQIIGNARNILENSKNINNNMSLIKTNTKYLRLHGEQVSKSATLIRVNVQNIDDIYQRLLKNQEMDNLTQDALTATIEQVAKLQEELKKLQQQCILRDETL